MLTLFVVLGTTMFAQSTWYVNSDIGNDGRNGLSATIPTPDDFVTGPKRTIGGAAGALAASNAGDIIVLAYTGINYSTSTGEPATISVTGVRTFQSIQGTNAGTPGAGTNSPAITSIFQVNTAAAANAVTFNSGEVKLSGGLTLTTGTLVNTSDLVTVSGTITRSDADATVDGQLKYSGNVDFNYNSGAAITVGDEFPTTFKFRHFTSTGAGTVVTIDRSVSMSGVITNADDVDLDGNTITITNSVVAVHAVTGNIDNGKLDFQLGGGNVTVNGAGDLPSVNATTTTSTARTISITASTAIMVL